ncbi:2,3-bisphosphoglycerate-dependent phosphoglycerate mutase-like [Physella acuta]|uniref:2,3-bisphosphoglycerate-dependent phosphoglycerate mutase-like n=1 Tax=Physella acuta TaxID=109671 RepID=UPI0027DB9977|nr:2,3-bisphosphoglycerate-dependent phosphoglycerate mutase-like [Physella acuta]
MATKYKIVLVRHGESVFTKQNLFCGFAHDADLTDVGIQEAIRAGQLLKENNYEFDIAFTSVLKRAIKTLYYIQEQLDCHWLPVIKSWRLNERHYGALQGLHKAETAAKYGEDQVKLWRRSYDVRPPPLERNDERWPGKARQYAAMDQGMIPTSESLKDTIYRTLPCWYDQIVPAIKSGQKVLIIAHGNSLRGIIKFLDKLSDEDIVSHEVPTGIPMVYELDEDLQKVTSYYLASDEEVAAAKALIADQGKIKK